jgi:hypothetical protein
MQDLFYAGFMQNKFSLGVLQAAFTEPNAGKSGLRIDNGFELMEYFLKS